MMPSVVFDAKCELSLPIIDPIEFDQGLYGKRPSIKMRTCFIVENAVVTMPDGKRMVIPKLMVESIRGRLMPVVEDDKVVLFKMEDAADVPIVIGG